MKNNTTKSLSVLNYAIFSVIFVILGVIFIIISNSLNEKEITTAAKNDSPIVVVIDAGHGGEDGGTVGVNQCYEKDINLKMAKKLQVFLSSMGIKSVLTRDTDILLYDRNQDFEGRKKHLDMLARLKIANSFENVIFISIHQNAFPQEKYSGFQTYYSQNNESSLTLAKIIEEGIKKHIQPDNKRKAKMSAGKIYLLDKLNCPAVLLECGFLSNPTECELLCSEEYQNKLCAVIANCLLQFYDQ